MKKVLIIIGSFEIGGSRTSMVSLLSSLDAEKVKVDVFAREKKGPLISQLRNCTILPENIWLSHRMYECNFLYRFLNYFLYLLRGIMQYIGVDLFRLYHFIGGKQINSCDYDAVIAYDETLARILSSYPAKKRIIWIHCDYRRYYKGISEEKYYSKIDTVVCVSSFARDSFIAVYPQYSKKIVILPNMINVREIVEKSRKMEDHVQNLFDRNKDPFIIISIGRFDPVKQFDTIPLVASRIKEFLASAGIKKSFEWWIIGGGNEKVKSKISEKIQLYNVASEVLLLGAKANPYPYLSKAHLNVCTSSSETFAYTIYEGLALKKPFLCNDFPGAKEAFSTIGGGFVLPIADMPSKILEVMEDYHTFNFEETMIKNSPERFYSLL